MKPTKPFLNPKQKKCKFCKEKFTPARPLQYVCSPPKDCCCKYAAMLHEKKAKKDLNEKVKGWKVNTHAADHKKFLQAEINKLSRLIDAKFGYKCIDCGRDFGKQTDAAHYFSRSMNNSLRYHLDNLHSAASNCNMWDDKHKAGYTLGLEKRYGEKYLEYVESLPMKYPKLNLNNTEIVEKLALVRKLLRNFDTFVFADGREGRAILNKLIGIYC